MIPKTSCAYKPDWSKAPAWAKYLCMDELGDWYWTEREPYVDNANAQESGAVMNLNAGMEFRDGTLQPKFRKEIAALCPYEWEDSIESRPQDNPSLESRP